MLCTTTYASTLLSSVHKASTKYGSSNEPAWSRFSSMGQPHHTPPTALVSNTPEISHAAKVSNQVAMAAW